MVMRFDRVHNDGIHAIAPAEFCTQFGMCAFLVVVHGLADVMQEAGLLGLLYVRTYLSRQDARQLGDFHSMGKLVLTVGCSELETSHHAQDFGVQASDTCFIRGLFPGFIDDFFYSPGFILDNFLDVGRMNTAVQNPELRAIGA